MASLASNAKTNNQSRVKNARAAAAMLRKYKVKMDQQRNVSEKYKYILVMVSKQN